MREDNKGGRINRRRFLQATTGAAAALAFVEQTDAIAPHRVGVGKSADAYAATVRAIAACGQWPASSIAGRTVIIKPNLVNTAAATTGTTTDPHVVRAVVDLALAAGAANIKIVEYLNSSDKWKLCGYDIFSDYHSRVSLVPLDEQPLSYVAVPGGMAYQAVYLPSLLIASDVVFISVAKLKTHVNAVVTLTAKNLFGLPPSQPYQKSVIPGRFAMHDRGVGQTIVDLNIARPIHFAVVDGIWGMEGNGPIQGTPVEMNLVFAGQNAIAVDRICVQAMGIPQGRVQHLTYAARKQMGPSSISEIEVVGDAFTPRAFVRASPIPIVEYPKPYPYTIIPGRGDSSTITYWLDAGCFVRVEITQNDDRNPAVKVVRTLQAWAYTTAGRQQIDWDGRDDTGQSLPVGQYVIRVQATYSPRSEGAYATGRIWITE